MRYSQWTIELLAADMTLLLIMQHHSVQNCAVNSILEIYTPQCAASLLSHSAGCN
jgi:hypothetical protein